MPEVTVEFDTSRFEAAVKYVFENTQKSLPEIINRAALTTIIGGRGVTGAMQRTQKAARAKIMGVPVKLVAGRIMNKHKGQKLTKAQIDILVRKEYKRRVAAIGYTANVGWNNAAIAFGGRGIGKHAAGKGYASEGQGIKATAGNYVAELSNTTPAAGLIGWKPLQEALDDVSRDIVEHIGGKLEEVCNQANAR